MIFTLAAVHTYFNARESRMRSLTQMARAGAGAGPAAASSHLQSRRRADCAARTIAPPLLSGEHPKRDDARRCDTMQELANIIGGAIVTAREAERGETWQLGVANGTVTPPGHHGLAAPLAYALNDRDERLFIDIAGLL